jgi:hypothetical protein
MYRQRCFCLPIDIRSATMSINKLDVDMSKIRRRPQSTTMSHKELQEKKTAFITIYFMKYIAL